ncbi:MAG: hypothetical protein OXH69_10620 [Acidobacteria bacterium]|nr:hypothetical protein [Acidobacteriota bacterium]
MTAHGRDSGVPTDPSERRFDPAGHGRRAAQWTGEVFIILMTVFFLVAVAALMREARARPPAADIELVRDPEEQPPLIILDEASGYSFATGTHDLSPAFRRALDEKIVPAIAHEADACRCDVLEVFGHTDGQPYRGVPGARRGSLDTLPDRFAAGDLRGLTAGSNVELGYLRAAAVADYLAGLGADGGLARIRFLHFHSTGSMVLPSGKRASGRDQLPDAARRRIELRLSRSTDQHVVELRTNTPRVTRARPDD